MGEITPNISIFIPTDGDENYGESFAQGMLNIDNHDHSGGPTGGRPLGTSAIADFSITYQKLNANVADTTTGIGTNNTIGLQNQLQILGLLQNIFKIATTNGYIVKNGSNAAARTLTGTSNQINITNGDGTAGDPVFSLASPLILSTQPAFNFTCAPGTQSGVMGDTTVYDVKFVTSVFQNGGSNFDGTSTFTAPATGVYIFCVGIEFKGVIADCATVIQLSTSAPSTFGLLNINIKNIITTTGFGSTDAFVNGSQIVPLTQGQTVKVQTIADQSSAGSISIAGGYFSGALLF